MRYYKVKNKKYNCWIYYKQEGLSYYMYVPIEHRWSYVLNTFFGIEVLDSKYEISRTKLEIDVINGLCFPRKRDNFWVKMGKFWSKIGNFAVNLTIGLKDYY